MLTVAAVVGHDVGLVAGLAHLVFKDHHLHVARSFNEDDVVAGLLESVRCRQSHGRAHAAGQNCARAVVFNLRRLAEWPNDVQNTVARFQAIQQRCGLADGLNHNGDRARLGIGAFDGERNALAFFMQAQNEELARPLLACNARRLNDKLLDIEADRAGFDDLVHRCNSDSAEPIGHSPVLSSRDSTKQRSAGAGKRSEAIVHDY